MRTHNCVECGDTVAEARWVLGYNVCLPCGERLARQRVHTIAPLHKSNYMVISNRAELLGLNNKGGFHR
jgi:ribosomal protein L37AE/L43A